MRSNQIRCLSRCDFGHTSAESEYECVNAATHGECARRNVGRGVYAHRPCTGGRERRQSGAEGGVFAWIFRASHDRRALIRGK